jgi:hypothetical protein
MLGSQRHHIEWGIERVLARDHPLAQELQRAAVGVELDPTKAAAKVGERRSWPCGRPLDPRQEHPVGSANDVMADLALERGERIAEQRHTAAAPVNRQPRELVLAWPGKALGELVLPLCENADPKAAASRDYLLGGTAVVEYDQDHRRIQDNDVNALAVIP